MGISAVAVVRISSDRLGKELGPAPEEYRKAVAGGAAAGWPGALFLTGKNGTPFIVNALADGACIHTGASFAEEAEELSGGVRAVLGDLLDEHHDERGIFFFPDVTKPEAGETYDALVERVGDAGQWAPVVAEAAHEGAPDLGALMGALGAGGLGAGALGGGGLDALLGNVMAQLDPALIQQVAGALSGGAPGQPGQMPDVNALAQSVQAMMGQLGGPGGLETALQHAQEMVSQNPELQEIQKKLAEDMLRKK